MLRQHGSEEALVRQRIIKAKFNSELVTQLTGLTGAGLASLMHDIRRNVSETQLLLLESQEIERIVYDRATQADRSTQSAVDVPQAARSKI